MSDNGPNKRYIALKAEAGNWEEALRICGSALIEGKCVGKGFVEACVNREKAFPTGLPTIIPVAIPHAASDEVYKTSVCVLKLVKPIKFNRMDDNTKTIQAQLIFNLAVKEHTEHVDFLKKLIAFVMDEQQIKKCLSLPIEDIPDYLESTVV
ncbi:PTS sugar transporter subunit IIA [Pectinatus frisingensis]|uniref:PTS sugar transporter subunit IIA n=1 Tax=Pectinatus frisingensis TaxID=865 RepID=UPI0018C6E241|nr:PTS sugar transporter subunit IIA [Pectinatus frisingensis]